MPNISPAEAAQKHRIRTTAAVEDYKAGVSRVTESPTAQAAKNLEKARLRYNAAIDSGKTKDALLRVTTEDWKTAALQKGASRIASGVAASQGKVQKVYEELFPHIQRGQDMVSQMPDLTIEDAISRSRAMILHMAGFKRTK
jgi:hypothetical protein